jgi:hypothetical protein
LAPAGSLVGASAPDLPEHLGRSAAVAAPDNRTIQLGIEPLTRADIPTLCARVTATLVRAAGATEIVCDVATIVDPCADVVDALSRVQLTARRFGCEIRVVGASAELCRLIAFMGLREILPVDGRPGPSARKTAAPGSVGQASRRGGRPNIGK